MDFMDEMRNVLNNEKSVTENGAVGYRTTGKYLLDLNFSVASLRNMPENKIADKFTQAFYENKELAVKWLFYARDVREGLGERRLFRICFNRLLSLDRHTALDLLKYVPEYARWDDVFCVLTDDDDSYVNNVVYNLTFKQMILDKMSMANNLPISLMAKWLPSVNCSSKAQKALAKRIRRAWNMSEKEYRQTLSTFREYLDVVERKMCANEWGEINYSAVPSKANLLYKDAFMRNDEVRRENFLADLKTGKTKINSSVAFPHEIVHGYYHKDWYGGATDDTLEEMWKALPDLVDGNNNTLVVADSSGSMGVRVDTKSSVTAIEVSHALAIYFAERSSGAFKDKFITFSCEPKLVDLSNATTLRDKLNVARSNWDITNTKIEKTFDLILQTAINSNATQEEIPTNVLVISDMEFDWAVDSRPDETLFDSISRKFNEAGYKMPKLIFWNVNSCTNTIPVKENELGVALVSGFSVNILKMVMSNELDPYKILVEQLMSPRYDKIKLVE